MKKMSYKYMIWISLIGRGWLVGYFFLMSLSNFNHNSIKFASTALVSQIICIICDMKLNKHLFDEKPNIIPIITTIISFQYYKSDTVYFNLTIINCLYLLFLLYMVVYNDLSNLRRTYMVAECYSMISIALSPFLLYIYDYPLISMILRLLLTTIFLSPIWYLRYHSPASIVGKSDREN